MEISTTQQNWAGGELSPDLRSRSDLPVYHTGAERLVNFISKTGGPSKFRSGFQYAQNTRRHNPAWLLPFQFNDADAYELEFTTGFVRFYRNDGIVTLGAKTITGATKANPVVLTIVGHGYSNDDEIIVESVVGMTQLNGRSFVVKNKAADTVELYDAYGTSKIDGTGFDAYSSGGSSYKIYEVVSPYAIADVPHVKTAQNADTMYTVNRSYAPYKLVRTGPTSWTFATFSRTSDPFSAGSLGNWPGSVAFYQGRLLYGGTNDYPESIWGSLPLTSGNPQYDDFTLGTDPADAFKFTISPISGKVDNIEALVPCLNFLAVCTFEGISKMDGGTAGEAISPSNVDVTPVVTTGCLQQVTPFLLGISLVFIHRSALILYSMEFDIFYNAFNALDKNLTNDHWTESGIIQMHYFVGRPSGFCFVRNDGFLIWLSYMVKENINAADKIKIGGTSAKVLSAGVMPRANQYDQLWIVSERTINGKTARFVEYQNDDPVIPERDDFWSGDANEAADDALWRNAMFEAQKQYVYMDAALTYDGSDYGTNAAATLTPAALTGNSVDFAASAAVFDSSMVGRELWKQAQNGVGTGRAKIISVLSSTHVLCQILTAFDTVTAMSAGQWYLTTDVVGGLWHLEGESVQVLADGGEHPKQTVANGEISLEYQASVVHVGLWYFGLMRSMHLESKTPQVPSDARKMNINRLGVKFLNTLGARYGTNLYNMKDFQFGQSDDLMGRPAPLFSEHLVVPVEDFSDYNKHIYIQQVRPLPCTIEDLVPFIEFDEQ